MTDADRELDDIVNETLAEPPPPEYIVRYTLTNGDVLHERNPKEQGDGRLSQANDIMDMIAESKCVYVFPEEDPAHPSRIGYTTVVIPAHALVRVDIIDTSDIDIPEGADPWDVIAARHPFDP